MGRCVSAVVVDDWLACVTGIVMECTISLYFEWNGEEGASTGKAEKLNAEHEGKEVWMDE